MDKQFRPGQAAIVSDDAEKLEQLLRADPSLATVRSLSPCDHPTLLCCLVLEMPPRRSLEKLVRLFAELGAELRGPLVSAASIDNVGAVEMLVDLGAPIADDGMWSPLEEALYWGHSATVKLLLKQGATADNLRTYAALGDLQGIRRCFDGDARLNQKAGAVAWPFGPTIPSDVQRDPSQIMNNALVYAAAWGKKETAGELLSRGADINAIPAGFDFAGTPLHYAALNNRREMVDWLLARGADPTIRDTKVHNTADGWADHANHAQLGEYLRVARESREAV